MCALFRSSMSRLFTVGIMVITMAGLAVTPAWQEVAQVHAAQTQRPTHMNCATGYFGCTEVADSEEVFGAGKYVGHDEPSLLFYSRQPGSGNHMKYTLTLPQDPAPFPVGGGKAFNFQLHPAFWFGMALCDTQSYPEQLTTCTPNSDTNIVDPVISPAHPGTAFMELQFYPPGWVPFQQAGGLSCDPAKWCAALTIDSLSENPVTGVLNNAACLTTVGVEPVNFAFITRNGVAQAPANPVQATLATFTPNAVQDLFMRSGDTVTVTMADTWHGLKVDLQDVTSGQRGSMTASAANGFGQVKFDPTGITCQNLPYDFHPMYSTSSEQTRVPWAAHSYNIAFADEIGHFDYCHGSAPILPGGNCPAANTEGFAATQSASDIDDTFCSSAASSFLVPIAGCVGQNDGFDGVPYQPVWPDGNQTLHPTPIRFSSPLTGKQDGVNYDRVAFEADLPRIETNTCDRTTGAGCTLIPTSDKGRPAAFYPFFSTGKKSGKSSMSGMGCQWALGNHLPKSLSDFGQNAQYGTLLSLAYTAFGGGGVSTTRYNDFRQILSLNPCKA
ncbi:MAG TPA: hypothetical protein VKR06_41800 [Ktedonosporobacter sp.]|nr:hypothetical protein [Ktedonosporobacter sp.]